jgi:hypothetical protein
MYMDKIYLFAVLLVFFTSCSVIKPEKPMETYPEVTLPKAVSVINIPMELKVPELEKLLNNQVKGLLYEDNSLEDNGGDNLMVKAWKKEDIHIAVEDNVLSYRVPLKLWIKAGWKVEKFGLSLSDYREVNAEIALKFKTGITLNNDWSLTTETTSDGYEWLSTPVVKIGPVDVSVKTLANVILKSYQKTINKEIDKAIAGNLDLKKEIGSLLQTLQKPMKVNDEYNLWLTVSPQEVYSTPLSGKAGIIRHTLGIKSVIEASVGKEPSVNPLKTLPKMSLLNKPEEDFLINLSAGLSYDKVNELASQYLKGKTFTQGKYQLLINAIDIYGRDNKFIIHLNVAGSLKGDLYFTGIPYYNDSTTSLEVRDLDYDLKTRNALVKTGSWLFHGTLTRMIEKNMVFPMQDQLKAAQELLEKNINDYKLGEGFYLNGNMKELSIGDIRLTREAIQAQVLLKGKVRVIMK